MREFEKYSDRRSNPQSHLPEIAQSVRVPNYLFFSLENRVEIRVELNIQLIWRAVNFLNMGPTTMYESDSKLIWVHRALQVVQHMIVSNVYALTPYNRLTYRSPQYFTFVI